MRLASWARTHLDPVLVVCFAALVGFPLVAAMSAGRLPLKPVSAAAAVGVRHAAHTLRVVPAFSPGSRLERRMGEGRAFTDARRARVLISAALRDLLGHARGRQVMRLVSTASRLAIRSGPRGPVHPFAYPQLDPILDAALAAPLDTRRARQANDVAALLVLAAARFDNEFTVAPAVAFAILRRARQGGACVPQLNLAFLLSTDGGASDRVVGDEFARAERACPGDPTPTTVGRPPRSRTLKQPSQLSLRCAALMHHTRHEPHPFQAHRRTDQQTPSPQYCLGRRAEALTMQHWGSAASPVPTGNVLSG